MAKSNKGPQQPKSPQPITAQSPAAKPAQKIETVKKPIQKTTVKNILPPGHFQFGKMNYAIMFIGFIILAIGFILMSGGATKDPNVFPAKEIYSFQRITLAPFIIIVGFLVELFAIFYKEKNKPVAE